MPRGLRHQTCIPSSRWYSLSVTAARSLDPTPWNFKALLARLPARERASIAWFEPELRKRFVEPLSRLTDEAHFEHELDGHLVEFSLVGSRLSAALQPLLESDTLRHMLASIDDDKVQKAHHQIEERLGSIDPLAADALREAYATFISVLPILADQFSSGGESAMHVLALGEGELRAVITAELKTDAGLFLRLEALVIAAMTSIDDGNTELPPLIRNWCFLALASAHELSRRLRRSGVPLPAPHVPGFTEKQWRERWADRVFSGMSPKNVAGFERATARLRSGRAG